MFNLSKLIPYTVFHNLPNFPQISYARMVHQFRIEPKSPFLYPDRKQEMKNLEGEIKRTIEVDENKDVPMDHHYKLLGISKNATTMQIKAAYCTLAKKFQNYANSNAENQSQRFRDIVKAYHCLVNNVKNHEHKLDAKHMNIEEKQNQVTTSSSKSQVKLVPSLLDPPTKFINRRKSPNSAKDTLQTVAIKEGKALHLVHFLIAVRKTV